MTYGTMEKIETVSLTGTQASITFATLPTTYDDILIKVSARSTTSDGSLYISFNSSSANFSWRRLIGNGSAASSQSGTDNYAGSICRSTDTANTFGNAEIYIPNYRSSANKAYTADTVLENNATEAFQMMVAGLWSQTAAITNVSLAAATSFAANSSATLYGITRVPAGAKATGGVIYDDASYWYHVFTSSGTFTPSQSIIADCLVIAGGGGGGNGLGGGGGAGGLLAFASQSLTAQNYTITVGAGGAGSTSASTVGTNGVDSQFGSLTLVNGGGGGTGQSVAYPNGPGGSSGGSGGGGSRNGSNKSGGAATSGQGNAGGNGVGTNLGDNSAGAGGGGAGAVGANATTTAGGNGGNGLSTYSSWGLATGTGQNINGTVWYAGGGGGGNFSGSTAAPTGGNGGGGVGGTQSPTNLPSSGLAFTGGGGGGSAQNGENGASGGSGIVIVRYSK